MTDTDILERKNRELSAILEVSKILTSSFDLESNLSLAMRTLSKLLDMKRGSVFLLDRLTGGLSIVAGHGLTPEEIGRGRYKVGEGIVGSVFKSGSPMFVPNIGENPMFLNRTGSRPDKRGISFLCIPIRLKDETLGVIGVDRIYDAATAGVDDDIRVLEILSSLIAQFVKLRESYLKVDEERRSLKSELKEKYSLPNLIGESEKFQAVLKSVKKVAWTDTTVLLLGQSGTGKELIARTVHYQSPRMKGPFVAVNCAALPENLVEAELFGAEKGAFTGALEKRIGRFEKAEGGTLFLDEVGELPPGAQSKFLRVLQEKTFERVGSSKVLKANVRIIAATNRNLEQEVRSGNFREDLYWRLNVVSISLPSLRERSDDIPALVEFYLDKFRTAYAKNMVLDSHALNFLCSYGWPGNIRELANTIERLVIMSEKNNIGVEDLPLHLHTDRPFSEQAASSGTEAASLSTTVEDLERKSIIAALKENGFVKQRAANALGITARQLGYKILKYGIELKQLKGK